MATFASTANEAVAEAVSTEDNPSTADEAVATLASTVDEAVAKAASTADKDVDMIASRADEAVAEADDGRGGSAGTRTRQCVNRWRPCTHIQVFLFCFLIFILMQFSFQRKRR